MSITAMKQALAVLRGCLDHPDAEDAVAALNAAIWEAIREAEKVEPVEVAETFHNNSKPKGYVLLKQPQRN